MTPSYCESQKIPSKNCIQRAFLIPAQISFGRYIESRDFLLLIVIVQIALVLMRTLAMLPQVFPSESVSLPVVDVDQGVVFPQTPVGPVPLRHETPVMVTPPGTKSTGPPDRMLSPG